MVAICEVSVENYNRMMGLCCITYYFVIVSLGCLIIFAGDNQ